MYRHFEYQHGKEISGASIPATGCLVCFVQQISHRICSWTDTNYHRYHNEYEPEHEEMQ
jgi:hypothetical protein